MGAAWTERGAAKLAKATAIEMADGVAQAQEFPILPVSPGLVPGAGEHWR